MPIYEYECIKCGHKFEFLVRSSSEDISCSRCQKQDLKRLISSFAFNSKDASGNISSSSSSGCSSCASPHCSTCSG